MSCITANIPRCGDIPGILLEGQCLLAIIDQGEAASAARSLDAGNAFEFCSGAGI